jgi:hypothetical protein
MVDVSVHGAALLTSTRCRPALGEAISLSLVDPESNLDPRVSRLLLDRAKVLRLDAVAPSLNRVALHFDDRLWETDRADVWQELTTLFGAQNTPARTPS